MCRFGVVLDADAVGVGNKKAAVAAARIEHPLGLRSGGPGNERADDILRGVVGAEAFLLVLIQCPFSFGVAGSYR